MLRKKRNYKHLWVIVLMILAAKLSSSISIAQEQAAPATAKLKAISASMSPKDMADIRRLLELGADVNVASPNGITPLHVASFQGHPEIVKLLLDAGAKVNAENSGEFTALHMAAEKGHAEIVKLLLDAGAKVNAEASSEITALHLAAEKGHAEIAKLLLNAGAKVNADTIDGVTALILASEKNHIETVKLLLASNVNVNAKGIYNATALHVAAFKGHLEIVKSLLDAGAKVDADRIYGDTALTLASYNGHIETVQLLLIAGAKVNVDLEAYDNVIVPRGYNPYQSSYDGFFQAKTIRGIFWILGKGTPLILASYNGHTEIVKLLLDAGGKIDAATTNKATALVLASLKGHAGVVKLLLDAGAKVTADASVNIGYMYYSGKGVSKDYTEAAKWFLKAAQQGDTQAQETLGRMYRDGRGVQQDYTEAAKWFLRAAEEGDATARLDLGRMYLQGDGVPQDSKQAEKWIRKAADRDIAEAQSLLGRMYLKGDGVSQDSKKAAKWIREAAERGDTQAQETFGRMYLQGDGVRQDSEEAANWSRKAKERFDSTIDELGFIAARGLPSSDARGRERTLWWVYRNGREEVIQAPPFAYFFPNISPDGNKIALTADVGMNRDIWILGPAQGTFQRMTFYGGREINPAWSLDGRRIAYTSTEKEEVISMGGIAGVVWEESNGMGEAKFLGSSPGKWVLPFSWSKDGKIMVTSETGPDFKNFNIGMLSIEGSRPYTLLLKENYNEVQPQLSPDGRWLAYCTDELGKEQIYVRPFPNVYAGKWQVSTEGGNSPRWSPDGKELYYLIGEEVAKAVMAVDVETEPTFSHGKPKILFRGKYIGPLPDNGIPYDVHPDGQRFLMMKE